MSNDLANALDAVLERLVSLVASDDDLRINVRRLAQAVLDATAETESTAAQEDAPPVVAEQRPVESVVPEERVPAAELIKQLWPAAAVAKSPAIEPEMIARHQDSVPIDVSDLPMIEARCRLKAEGSRWVAKRQRRIVEGSDFQVEIAPLDREIIERAKAIPNCFLWMNHPSGPSPANLGLFEQLADCFETAADAVELLRAAHEDADNQCDLFDDALLLGAEAQSALRVAVAQIDGPEDDDQQSIFRWLRRTAGERQTFINRYMRIDDPADPANNGDLASRIEALDNHLQEARNVEKNRRRLLSKIRYESKKIQEAGNDAESHWDTLVRSVDDLVSVGVPPSNREMREYLLPIVDDFPDLGDVALNVQKVLEEIDRYLANLSVAEYQPAAQEMTDEVKKVGALLKGKSVLLIGGVCRPHAKTAIETAFGMSELLWPSAEPHEPLEKFRPLATREDVAVVLLAIRWTSHSYGEVNTICEEYGKPLVRLPGGYNPNQIAVQILEQCGDRLRKAADENC